MRRILLVSAVWMALMMVVVGSLIQPGFTRSFASHSDPQTAPAVYQQSPNLFTQLYQQVSPSVVAIRVTFVSRGQVVGTATGSGFVIDQQGHILTNNHVVDGASEIEIDFYDGTLAWGTIVGLDPDSDLAVLSVDLPAVQLHPLTFGNSDAVQIGETVLAIGSPFGRDWTLTSGIVSGLDRSMQGLSQFSIGGVIQTDAAINPGNSGGPLLNLQGQLIGINSQIATTTDSNSGVGFAIPGNLAYRVAQQLISQGRADYSYLGISGTDVTLALIDALSLPDNTRGVVVTTLAPDGPATRAGLQEVGVTSNGIPRAFDIITGIDGHALRGMDDLISYLARYTMPGQMIQLSVLRNGAQTLDIPVQLTARP